MRQLNYVGNGKFKWINVSDPKIDHVHQVIAKPLAVGRCDGDVVPTIPGISYGLYLGHGLGIVDPMVRTSLGKAPFKPPTPVGHEAVAEIIETGHQVKKLKLGDRIVIPWSISCGSCRNCFRDLTSHCEKAGDTMFSGWGFGSVFGPSGGMASDFIKVPFAESMAHKLPPGADPLKYVALSDNLSDAWRAVRSLRSDPSMKVCVLGGGAKSIGLYAAGLAVALGSKKVSYVDSSRTRLDVAEKYGSTVFEISRKFEKSDFARLQADIGPVNLGVEARSTVKGINFLISTMDYGGSIFALGYYFFKRVSINLFSMYAKSVSLNLGVSHPSAVIPEILDFLDCHSFDPTVLYSKVSDFDSAENLYGRPTTKLVLVPN